MVKVSGNKPPPRASSSRQLAIIKPPSKSIAIYVSRKDKSNAVYYVRVDSRGRHYGCSSTDPTRIILTPASASRADGDLEKNTPPNSPNRDSTSVFTCPKPYVVEQPPVFKKPKDTKLYEALLSKGKTPTPLLYPDREDLSKLGILEEIRNLLTTSGLGFIFKDDPGCVKPMVMEFLSSFNPVVKPEVDGSEIVKCWKFQLGGLMWEVDADVLHDWFRFPRDGKIDEFNDREVHRFWFEISGEDFRGEKRKTTFIRPPKWKLIHKFLGGIIFVRASYGRLVSRTDLEIMMMIQKGRKVDWLLAITRGIQDNLKPNSMFKGLGGGSFITWIARKLNFTFDDLEVSKERLHLTMMRARHILGQGLAWKNPLPEENEGSEEAIPMDSESDHEASAPQTDIPSSSTHPPPSHSSLDHKLDLLLAKVDAQSTVNNHILDSLRWNERMVTTIAKHLGLYSEMDPPPEFPSAPPREPQPNPPSSKGKAKVIASSSSGDGESMARYMIQIHDEVAEKIIDDEGSPSPGLNTEGSEAFDDLVGMDDFEAEVATMEATNEPTTTPRASITKSTTPSSTDASTSSSTSTSATSSAAPSP